MTDLKTIFEKCAEPEEEKPKESAKVYKLFRQRRDGSLGPLFINRQQRIPLGEWMEAEDHPTPGFAHRPGWHATFKPHAPHLKMQPKGDSGRVWVEGEAEDYDTYDRPESQGGLWVLAQKLKANRIMNEKVAMPLPVKDPWERVKQYLKNMPVQDKLAVGLMGAGGLAYLTKPLWREQEEKKAEQDKEKPVAEEGEPVSRTVAQSLGAVGNTLTYGPLITGLKGYQDLPLRDAKKMLAMFAKQHPHSMGGVKFRTGGMDVIDDMFWKRDPTGKLPWYKQIGGRHFQNPRSSLLMKILGMPMTATSSVFSPLVRSSHYNPLTDVAHTFSSAPAIGQHELGHVLDLNLDEPMPKRFLPRLGRKLTRDAYTIAAGLPIANLWRERQANKLSHNVLKKALKAKKLREAETDRISQLPAAYSTYLMNNAGMLAPGLAPLALPVAGGTKLLTVLEARRRQAAEAKKRGKKKRKKKMKKSAADTEKQAGLGHTLGNLGVGLAGASALPAMAGALNSPGDRMRGAARGAGAGFGGTVGGMAGLGLSNTLISPEYAANNPKMAMLMRLAGLTAGAGAGGVVGHKGMDWATKKDEEEDMKISTAMDKQAIGPLTLAGGMYGAANAPEDMLGQSIAHGAARGFGTEVGGVAGVAGGAGIAEALTRNSGMDPKQKAIVALLSALGGGVGGGVLGNLTAGKLMGKPTYTRGRAAGGQPKRKEEEAKDDMRNETLGLGKMAADPDVQSTISSGVLGGFGGRHLGAGIGEAFTRQNLLTEMLQKGRQGRWDALTSFAETGKQPPQRIKNLEGAFDALNRPTVTEGTKGSRAEKLLPKSPGEHYSNTRWWNLRNALKEGQKTPEAVYERGKWRDQPSGRSLSPLGKDISDAGGQQARKAVKATKANRIAAGRAKGGKIGMGIGAGAAILPWLASKLGGGSKQLDKNSLVAALKEALAKGSTKKGMDKLAGSNIDLSDLPEMKPHGSSYIPLLGGFISGAKKPFPGQGSLRTSLGEGFHGLGGGVGGGLGTGAVLAILGALLTKSKGGAIGGGALGAGIGTSLGTHSGAKGYRTNRPITGKAFSQLVANRNPQLNKAGMDKEAYPKPVGGGGFDRQFFDSETGQRGPFHEFPADTSRDAFNIVGSHQAPLLGGSVGGVLGARAGERALRKGWQKQLKDIKGAGQTLGYASGNDSGMALARKMGRAGQRGLLKQIRANMPQAIRQARFKGGMKVGIPAAILSFILGTKGVDNIAQYGATGPSRLPWIGNDKLGDPSMIDRGVNALMNKSSQDTHDLRMLQLLATANKE